MSTKKTSSYNKDKKDEKKGQGRGPKGQGRGKSQGPKKDAKKGQGKVQRGKKYAKKSNKNEKQAEKMPKKEFVKKEFAKKDFAKKGRDDDEDDEPIEKSISTFDPYYNEQARIHKVECFACKQEKMVAFEPIDGIPVICDDCLVDLEAKRLLDLGGMQKTKKLSCQWCDATFYGLNDSYLFCNDCYDKFSHEIKARRKGLVSHNCDDCGKETWLPPRIMDLKKENNEKIYCRDCMDVVKAEERREKSKSRIQQVKNRLKNKD